MRVCIFVGKLLLRRRRRLIDRQLKKMRGLIIPAKSWLSLRRAVMASQIAKRIEGSMTRFLMHNLQARWIHIIIFLQTQIRLFLAKRRSIYAVQLRRVRRLASSIRGERNKTGAEIPEGVLVHFIRKKVREELESHLMSMKFYRLVSNKAASRGERKSLLSAETKLHSQPTLSLDFSKEVYQELLRSAESSRLVWDQILDRPSVKASRIKRR
jgi:hypothetical protein